MKKVQINVWWHDGGSSDSFADYLKRMIERSCYMGGLEFRPVTTNGERSMIVLRTDKPDKVMLAIDTELLQGGFSTYDPEGWLLHDPFSVRYQVMPMGLEDPSLCASTVNYLTEKTTHLSSQLLTCQSRLHQLEQMVQQAQHINLHEHGLKYLPDIVKHVNEQLTSIGCQPYEIPQIKKH